MTPSIPSKFPFTRSNRKRRNDHETNVKKLPLTPVDFLARSPKTYATEINDSRRAHHNELERKRRDHIKDHFLSLKNAIPVAEGGKILSSRASILKRALEYITTMKKRISKSQDDVAQLRIKNEQLEAQVKLLEQPELPIATNIVKSPTDKLSAVTQLSGNSCSTPGSSTNAHSPSTTANLLPNLNTPPTSLTTTTTTTVTNVFPLACSSTSQNPKATVFTQVACNSLLPPSSQYGDHLFQTIVGQLMHPIISDTSPFQKAQQ